MSFAYLAALLLSLACMVVVDHRFRLFFFRAPRAAALVTAAGVLFFLVWDLLGIALGIFFRGESAYMTGWLLAPELPVEEAVFLTLLSYLTMNLYTGVRRLLASERS